MNSSRLFFVVISALVGTVGLLSCGSDSNSNSSDPAALCRQTCEKTFDLCLADAGAIGASSKATCLMGCSTPSNNNTNSCSNSAAILAAVKACLNQTTCVGYTTCAQTIPECIGTGAGGASGTGGGGTAGRSGGTGGVGGSSPARTGGASGTAGASGTGGISGVGGAGGSAPGRGCQDLLACCNATTNPVFQSACTANYSAAMAMGDAVCASAFAMVRATLCPGL